MRPRRRRPRGPRPPQSGPNPEAGAFQQQQPSMIIRRRRRRPRGNNRPLNNSSPQPYAGAPMGGMNNAPPRGPGPGLRRRRRPMGRMNGAAEKRRGLEVLRDLQQVGVALDPTERLTLELKPGKGAPPYGDRVTGRALDLIAPIGRGQRCLIVSPPKAGKTRILQIIAASVAFNHPDVGVYALLVDERPEEVTDFKRNTPAQVIAAYSDMSIDEHIETAEHAMEVVAAQVLEGKDVVLLLDSITRLARAYNAGFEGSGRTLSGGLDSSAMQSPPARAWTRSFSRSSRAPGTARSTCLASWRSGVSIPPSTSRRAAPARKRSSTRPRSCRASTCCAAGWRDSIPRRR